MRDLKCSYDLRTKQKALFFKLGEKGLLPSFLLAIVGLIIGVQTNWYILGVIGLFSLYLGVASVLFFARIGWSNNRLIDLVFNQFSVVLAIVGLGVSGISIFIVDIHDNLGYGMFLVGCLFMFIGNRLSSKPPIDLEAVKNIETKTTKG